MDAVLEREKTRYEYIKALRESTEYLALPAEPADKRNQYITDKLRETYSFADNGSHQSIDNYGKTKKIRPLLEEAQKSKEKKPIMEPVGLGATGADIAESIRELAAEGQKEGARPMYKELAAALKAYEDAVRTNQNIPESREALEAQLGRIYDKGATEPKTSANPNPKKLIEAVLDKIRDDIVNPPGKPRAADASPTQAFGQWINDLGLQDIITNATATLGGLAASLTSNMVDYGTGKSKPGNDGPALVQNGKEPEPAGRGAKSL